MLSGQSDPLCADSDFRQFQCQLQHIKSENSLLRAELASMDALHRTEMAKEKAETDKFREKYDLLLNDHNKVLKLNAELEERLLVAVESLQKERTELNEQINALKEENAEAKETIGCLTTAWESCKSDCKLATELLRDDPSRFLPLNSELSSSSTKTSSKSVTAPIDNHSLMKPTHDHLLLFTTFPPIAVYSMERSVFSQPSDAIPSSQSTSAKPSPPSSCGPILDI